MVKEFTESWIQALTLSVQTPAARRIRPWLSDIDLISASVNSDDQQAAADRVWNYATENHLAPWIWTVPSTGGLWIFEDAEDFTFTPAPDDQPKDLARWKSLLGIGALQVKLIAQITHDDWINLLRRESVRRSKPLNMSNIPSGSMFNTSCIGTWKANQWVIQFDNPNWLDLQFTEPFRSVRPSLADQEEVILATLDAAGKKLLPRLHSKTSVPSDTSHWADCIPVLKDWHHSMLSEDKVGLPAWARRAWNCVWPVVYRERNKLKGECDVQFLRKELAECFNTIPEFTEWLFVFAKLFCQQQLGSGLGTSGDYIDG